MPTSLTQPLKRMIYAERSKTSSFPFIKPLRNLLAFVGNEKGFRVAHGDVVDDKDEEVVVVRATHLWNGRDRFVMDGLSKDFVLLVVEDEGLFVHFRRYILIFSVFKDMLLHTVDKLDIFSIEIHIF